MAKLSIQFVRLSMIGRYNWLLEYTWPDHNHFRVTKQLSWINRGKCNAFVERICSTNWLSLSYPQYGQAKGANCCSSHSKRVDYILAHYNFPWEDAIPFNLSNCQMLTKLQVVDIMAYNLASPWFEGIFFFTNLGQLFSKFTKEIFIKLSYIFYP